MTNNTDYWATTAGLALGLPISFGLAATVQLTRWRAAKLAQPIPGAADIDQDALKKSIQDKQATKSNKFKSIVIGSCFALYMGFIFMMDRFPSFVKLGFWGGLSCALATLHVASTIVQITGAHDYGLGRHSNSDLHLKEFIRSWYRTNTTILLALSLCGLYAFVPFVAPGNVVLSMGAFFFIAAAVPFRVMTNFTRIFGGKSAPLKWRLFGMAGVILGFLGLFALCWGVGTAISYAFPSDSSSKAPKKKEKMDPAFAATFMKIMVHSFLPLQFCTLMGSLGGIFMPMYRVDWLLANNKNKSGVQLEDDAGVETEREIFSATRTLPESVDELERKDLGQVVMIPSLLQLIKRGQIGHFLAKPVYTGTAMLTIQGTMLGCTWMGKRLDEVLDSPTRSDPLNGTMIAILSNFASLALLPFTVAFTLAIVSGLKGDFGLVFNHRADWSVHPTGEGEGESEALLRVEKELGDEKAELKKEELVDLSG